MKMLLVSVLIMLTIVIASAANCKIVTSATSELIDALDSISDEYDTEGAERLSALWDSLRDYLLFTVPMPRLEATDNAILTLKASTLSNSRAEYERGLSTTRRSIEEIALYSSFDIKNIL